MNDKIRIGSASVPKTSGVYYPFMVRTSKNNIAYGMLRPNMRAKNPRVSSTQIFMFDTTSTRINGMVKVGSLKGSMYNSFSITDVINTRDFRLGLTKTLTSLGKPYGTPTQSTELRKSHFPVSFVKCLTEGVGVNFSRA